MLVASLVLSENPSPHTRRSSTQYLPRRTSRERDLTVANAWAPAALIAWAAIGMVVLACMPGSCTDAVFGATLPFWLIGAPLIDLAWLLRARLLRALRGSTRSPLTRSRLNARRSSIEMPYG